MSQRPSYLKQVVRAIGAMVKGLRLTGRHYRKGYRRPMPLGIADPDYFKQSEDIVTIQYPMQKVPIPDNGRYRLFMETEDCIGCDKCARICPVDCITIETFRADGDLGKTSDGTLKRLHLPTFDIDMGKCMYCGLCTTVCPTECLTMTPVYDYSEYDRDNLVYHFGAYSPEQEVQLRTEISDKKAQVEATPAAEGADTTNKRRPILRRAAPEVTAPISSEPPTPQEELPPVSEAPNEVPVPPPGKRPRPVLPRPEPAVEDAKDSGSPVDGPSTPPVKRPRPVIQPPAAVPTEEQSVEPAEEESHAPPPAKRPRPVMQKPGIEPNVELPSESDQKEEAPVPPPAKRPRPVMPKPSIEPNVELPSEPDPKEEAPVPPPAKRPRPIMQRPPEDSSSLGEEEGGPRS